MSSCQDPVDLMLNLLRDGIDRKLFSAVQFIVSDPREEILNAVMGKTRVHRSPIELPEWTPFRDITADSLFDVASLTKPLATASLAMCAVDEHRLDLDRKLITLPGQVFPSWLLGCTVAQLLSHQTPLPAWVDFHGAQPRLVDHEGAKAFVRNRCKNLEPRDDENTWCYSDIGYILLGFLLEDIYQENLDTLFATKIARPLGLESQMMYRPLHQVSRCDIVATCKCCGSYIQGHTDDANARAMTHMAGHAGIFASAQAVTTFVRRLLNHDFPCSASTIDRFLSYHNPNTPFALGWDRPTSDTSLSGRRPGEHVIGHLGFTGCSVWVDMDTQRIVTMLTNRTHMNDVPSSIADLRRELHRLAWNY